jgi:hypothetical protein
MKPIYNGKGWVLGICTNCERFNYVEPHGTTAQCKCSKVWTEHTSVPFGNRNLAGTHLVSLPAKRGPRT